MANLTRGQTFGATETVTNTKLHNLVDSATIANIEDSDVKTDHTLPIISTTTPTSPRTGQLWMDTNVTPAARKIYDGTSFVTTIKSGENASQNIDSDGNVTINIDQDADSGTQIFNVRKNDASTLFEVSEQDFNKHYQDVRANADSTLDFGEDAVRWANGYFDTYHGVPNTATGSDTGTLLAATSTLTITMNDLSMFPNLAANYSAGDITIGPDLQVSDPASQVSTFDIINAVSASANGYFVNWKYITASDKNLIWVVHNNAGRFVRLWEAEDPILDMFGDEIIPIRTKDIGDGESIAKIAMPSLQTIIDCANNLLTQQKRGKAETYLHKQSGRRKHDVQGFADIANTKAKAEITIYERNESGFVIPDENGDGIIKEISSDSKHYRSAAQMQEVYKHHALRAIGALSDDKTFGRMVIEQMKLDADGKMVLR